MDKEQILRNQRGRTLANQSFAFLEEHHYFPHVMIFDQVQSL